jgi:site-specific DNA recombinase
MDDKRAALYARVSSQRQADELTIHSQVAALRERIAADGLHLDEALCFLDEGCSGASLMRPALERLRDLAWIGGLDRLYVHSPDRLARKYACQMVLLDELTKHGVEVVFLNHAPDASPEGELLLQMQGMIAEYERAKILERTRRGRRFAARQGRVSVLTHAPYGYRYVPKHAGDGTARYDVMPTEAALVREMFSWVGVEGLSLQGVVRRLAERGVPTATGQPRWDRVTVRGLLINPAYTGTARYGKTRLGPRFPGKRAKRGDPETPRREQVTRPTLPEEQEPIPVPALVSADLFASVAERLAENQRRQREQKQGAAFLLSGLLVCERCGSAYCGHRMIRSGRPPYAYYRCLGTDKYRHGAVICHNRAVNSVELEQAVWADLRDLLHDPDRLRREFERRLERPEAAVPERAHLERSIAQLKRRLGRLLDAYEQGWVEKPDMEPRLRRVQEQLRREQAVLLDHQQETSQLEELRLVIGDLATFTEQIRASLDSADFATKRWLLKLLIKRVDIGDQEVRIVYRVQPGPFVQSLASHHGQRGILQHCLKRRTVATGGAQRNPWSETVTPVFRAPAGRRSPVPASDKAPASLRDLLDT